MLQNRCKMLLTQNRIHVKEPRLDNLLLDVNAVSKYLGISRSMVYNLIRNKEIPSLHIGDRRLFHRPTIAKWAEQKQQQSS